MKKLLTCLFSLMMAVAILSPVTMSAAEKTHTVTITVNDEDFRLAKGMKSKYVVENGDDFDALSGKNWDKIVTYTGKLEYVDLNDIDKGWDTVVPEVRVSKKEGRNWVEATAEEASQLFKGQELETDYRIEVSFTIDYIGGDYTYEPGNGNGYDDRTDKVYTFKVEGFDEVKGKATGKFETYNLVLSEDDELNKVLKSLPEYDDYQLVGEDSIEHNLVFYVKGDVITARWEAEPENRIVNGTPEEEKEYDELDANKDGVVSCEEALGKGWVWNNETSACELKGSSNTGSYVPNTATK